MLYIGLPLYQEEIERLFEASDPTLSIFMMIQLALEKKGSKIGLHYLDKNVYVLGYEIPDFWKNIWGRPTISVEDSVILILQKKKEWKADVKELGLNLSTVTLARMEDEDEVMTNPEPFLIEG